MMPPYRASAASRHQPIKKSRINSKVHPAFVFFRLGFRKLFVFFRLLDFGDMLIFWSFSFFVNVLT